MVRPRADQALRGAGGAERRLGRLGPPEGRRALVRPDGSGAAVTPPPPTRLDLLHGAGGGNGREKKSDGH